MAVLAEYCLPFIKVGGCLMAYKGPEAAEEAEAAKNAISFLVEILAEIYDASLEKYDISHKIVVIKKVKNTVSKYPRKAAHRRKNPYCEDDKGFLFIKCLHERHRKCYYFPIESVLNTKEEKNESCTDSCGIHHSQS